MIRYAMRCSRGHRFEGWFRDSETFDRLKAAGQVSCSVCGISAVEKDIMAPAVASGRKAAPPSYAPPSDAPPSDAPPPHAAPARPAAPGPSPKPDLAALRAKIESISDDVGRDFAAEARRIHEGDAPERPILGEATGDEAKALAEDNIPVVPLPWWNRRNG